jgi:hypothetical protein
VGHWINALAALSLGISPGGQKIINPPIGDGLLQISIMFFPIDVPFIFGFTIIIHYSRLFCLSHMINIHIKVYNPKQKDRQVNHHQNSESFILSFRGLLRRPVS